MAEFRCRLHSVGSQHLSPTSTSNGLHPFV
jgi:hypothetical protein